MGGRSRPLSKRVKFESEQNFNSHETTLAVSFDTLLSRLQSIFESLRSTTLPRPLFCVLRSRTPIHNPLALPALDSSLCSVSSSMSVDSTHSCVGVRCRARLFIDTPVSWFHTHTHCASDICPRAVFMSTLPPLRHLPSPARVVAPKWPWPGLSLHTCAPLRPPNGSYDLYGPGKQKELL